MRCEKRRAAELRAQLEGLRDVAVLPPQDDVTDLFRSADVVVCAAGSTVWELCALGVPAMAIPVADNQRELPAELERIGAGVALGALRTFDPRALALSVCALLSEPNRRREMSARGRRAVDAKGASRVAARLVARADERSAMR